MMEVLYVLRMRWSIVGISCAAEGGAVCNMRVAMEMRMGKILETMVDMWAERVRNLVDTSWLNVQK